MKPYVWPQYKGSELYGLPREWLTLLCRVFLTRGRGAGDSSVCCSYSTQKHKICWQCATLFAVREDIPVTNPDAKSPETQVRGGNFTIFATMMDNDWKKRLGVVYSTDPNFKYEQEAEPEVETLEPSKQNLIVAIDRRARAGKQVTLVKGFVGSESDLATLGKSLKVKCGVGGTAKDGEITLQGDLRDKVVALLQSMGYRAKRGN